MLVSGRVLQSAQSFVADIFLPSTADYHWEDGFFFVTKLHHPSRKNMQGKDDRPSSNLSSSDENNKTSIFLKKNVLRNLGVAQAPYLCVKKTTFKIPQKSLVAFRLDPI